jgi:hypothetical protein
MIPLYHILVHIPSAVNDTIKVGESELYLDTKFNEFQHRTMKAKVVGIPAKFKSELEIGDYVFHHHHVALNDTQVVDPKEKIYRVNYDPFGGQGNQAYLIEKPDGSLIAVADWVFLEPFDIDADLREELHRDHYPQGTRKALGPYRIRKPVARGEGLAVGDVVYFAKDADYEMDINGRKLWRMQIHHLICQKL